MGSSPPLEVSSESGGSKHNNTYFLVPSLKSIITHKLISFIYEDNKAIPLHQLNADILEYITSRMPFCVIYRIYELKLAGDLIGLDFLKKYACSTYAPLPIWVKPSPLNKDHKYLRSRTKLILLQRQSSAESLSSSTRSSTKLSPTTATKLSPISTSTSISTTTATSTSATQSTSTSSSASASPISQSVTVHTLRQLDAMDFGARKARKVLREVLKKGKGARATHSEGEQESSEDSAEEGAKDFYINCNNTQADHRANKAG